MKSWYGNCPNKAEDCSYGHAKTDLCPFLVRDGTCTKKVCSLLHVDPRVTFKAKAAKAKPKGVDLTAVFEKAAAVSAAIPKATTKLKVEVEDTLAAVALVADASVKSFILQHQEREIQEEDEEEEELDDDVKTVETELPALRLLLTEKEFTKAAKKERRAARLAERGM
jgi:hypothetical protein